MRKFLDNAICGAKDVAKTVGLKRALIGLGVASAAVGGAFLIKLMRKRGEPVATRANAQSPSRERSAAKLHVKRAPASAAATRH